jgi:hypothetical protein
MRTHKKSWMGALALLAFAATNSAHAFSWVEVGDASQLQYQTWGDGVSARVYFRNVNHFDSSAMGCCYNYYIDLATPDGRAIFAIFLSAAARNVGIRFAVPDGYAAGPVVGMGQWNL